ncbi:hypothetical protein BCL90_1648, partial [Pedobacter alluvionis]
MDFSIAIFLNKKSAEALEKAYAEEVARETAEEAKQARKRLHSLKK